MVVAPTPYQVCICFVIRTGPRGVGQVLLGRKKTGLGLGNVVGLGGKLEAGESALQAIVREVAEESGLIVAPGDLNEKGYLRYRFPTKESWSQDSTVFVTRVFQGEPVETEEISPAWYDLDALPLEKMWDDARYWLPRVLAGEEIRASFTFAEDLATVATSSLFEQEC